MHESRSTKLVAERPGGANHFAPPRASSARAPRCRRSVRRRAGMQVEEAPTLESHTPGIMELIHRAPWREAVTFRDSDERSSSQMTTPDEGMEYVDVHERWRYEDRHFTPWLADNLHMLGGALGMNLKLVQTEKPVGPFFCDILAKERGSGVAGRYREPVGVDRPQPSRSAAHLRGRAGRANRGMGRSRFSVRTRQGPAPAQQMDARRAQVLRRQGNGVEHR